MIYLATIALLSLAQGLRAQNVGIGTTAPTAPLDVNGAVRIRGGAPAAGRVLTSDANGNASWAPAVRPGFVLSDNPADAALIANNYEYMASTLFSTKKTSSVTSTPMTWLGSARFMNGRPAPAVINTGGNNFLVFGGYDGGHYLSNGAIYDAIADTWTAIPDIGDGIERSSPIVVWAGNKLLVWGGTTYLSVGNSLYHSTGAIYDPATQTWLPMNNTGAPTGRTLAAAAYNPGTNEVAIWSGDGTTTNLSGGAKYNLTTNTWTTMSTVNAPAGCSRMGFAGNDAGKLFIYGGYVSNNNYSASAHFYDFATNSWTLLPSAGLTARYGAQVAFSGGKYIVWGSGNGSVNNGAIYDAGTNTWSLMSSAGAPNSYVCKSAVSNGYLVAVGYTGCAKYDINGNAWSSMPDNSRAIHGVAASNTCVFTWGGQETLDAGAPYVTDGSRFFWSAQSTVIHPLGILELHLYKKN